MIAVNIECISKRIYFAPYVREIAALLEHFKIPYAKWRTLCCGNFHHDDFIKWKHFPRYFVRRIHRSPVNSPHKGQWRGAMIFSLIWAWINGWVNKHEAGDEIRHRVHYDVTVMSVMGWVPISLKLWYYIADCTTLIISVLIKLFASTYFAQYIHRFRKYAT